MFLRFLADLGKQSENGDLSPLKLKPNTSDAPGGIDRWFRRMECTGSAKTESFLKWGRGVTRPGGASDEVGIE